LGGKSTRNLKFHQIAAVSSVGVHQRSIKSHSVQMSSCVALSSFSVNGPGRHEPTVRTSQSTIIRTIDITCLCPRRHFSLIETATCMCFSFSFLFFSLSTRVNINPWLVGYTRTHAVACVYTRTYDDQVSQRFTCQVEPGSCAGVFHSVLWTVVVRAAADLHVCSTRIKTPEGPVHVYGPGNSREEINIDNEK